MGDTCFHCGSAIAPGTGHAAEVDGAPRAFCCGGCEAAARTILAQGLGRYYELRTAGTPVAFAGARSWAHYDRDAALRRYTHLRDDGTRDASVRIDGMHCAACAWLIENSLRAVDGLCDIVIDPSGGRAELRYDPGRVALASLLERIEMIGYAPRPLAFSASRGDDWAAERRAALRRLGVAGFGMMQVMTFAYSLYVGALDGIAPDLERLLRFVSLLVATPVVLYSAQPFFAGAWRSLRARRPGMDVPVALGIGGAYAWSVFTTLRGYGEVYFDSVVMFTFFLLAGRFVEMSLRHRAGRHADALARLLPDGALRVTDGRAERVTVEELSPGDRVRVRPGERVPADGEVVSGRTEVDEALLTGESVPVVRGTGDTLIAGSLNVGGVVEMRVTRTGQDSTLATVARLLERAQGSRPPVAELADRVAGWFVVGVLLLAAAVGLYWWQTDPARAFPIVLAVLVVTCPCALSLATPAALAAATTRLARTGLLVTRTRAIEALARADRFVFDKTGTLTRGQLRIDDVRLLSERVPRHECIALAAALEAHSEHPVARAFAGLAGGRVAHDVVTIAGSGVEGTVNGRRYRIGRPDYALAIAGAEAPDILTHGDARTAVVLADADGPLAAFLLADELRADAAATLVRLRALGIDSRIASGDRPEVVAACARRLGGLEHRGGASAADKLALVRELQAQGHVVATVGDGVNDAPLLAGADVSVAIGGGSDLAKVSADIVLPGADLAPLAAGVAVARRTLAIVRENLAWAIVYNAAAVPLAAMGMLTPWAASIGMSASSLLVVLNAARLLRGAPARAPAANAPVALPAAGT